MKALGGVSCLHYITHASTNLCPQHCFVVAIATAIAIDIAIVYELTIGNPPGRKGSRFDIQPYHSTYV